MSWLTDLGDELSARGITGRERHQIVVELRDHIDCEPGCEERLGDPQELAASFADELAGDRARRSAFSVFGALAVAAVALIVSQLAIGHAGGYPGFANGLSVWLFVPAALGMFIAPQVALVAGTLAVLRAARRRRARTVPAAEIALIRRRAWIGAGAGFATVIGLELYVLDFSSALPGWWLGLVSGLTAAAAVALLAASRQLVHARAIVSGIPGGQGDVFDDLPAIRWPWLRRHPWRLGIVASLIVAVVMTLVGWHAEHSLIEGVERGALEGLAAAAGLAVLGRAVGVAGASPRSKRRTVRRSTRSAAGDALAGHADMIPDLLAADEDRSAAELVLRESFAHGRLSLDELTTRVTAVHEARTIGQLRAALSDLPPDNL